MFHNAEEMERRELNAIKWRARAKRNWRVFGLALLILFALGLLVAIYDAGFWNGFEDGKAEGRVEGVALMIK